jgi:sarcosine oxidase
VVCVSWTERADVVIVGAGLLGLSTAYALRGRRDVIVLEQATVGHARAGSHGPSRIFRLGYPDPLYVTMARRARDGWRTVEAEADAQLLDVTGQLSFGPGADDVFDALTFAGAPVHRLGADEVADRFPNFAGHGPAVFEPESGVLAAADVLDALRRLAGCDVREQARVRRVVDHEDGVDVETNDGTISARTSVVTAGPWTSRLVPSIHTFATLEHVAYLRARESAQAELPVFIDHAHWSTPASPPLRSAPTASHREPAVYGLPTPRSDLYKIALHHDGAVVDPSADDLGPAPGAVQSLEAATRHWLPAFEPRAVEIDTCLYDNTSDEDFIIDRIGNVVIGAGTSGHGFKFGPVFGELLAAVADGSEPPIDVTRFRRDRARLLR